ncbi:hypothetical protein CAP31_00165 [Sulfuriferula sp. AH1]|uniref:transposase n=1 Tax=Sulfuriferula sp. AH1 TaxID=1985873 RepID=UPI000B3B42A8|nr:transposase [Sulfuriferula sp. AH1]ARU30246.1 hypothetical protein CAP31_00165 [Sulfuriferula sp. AH1]
MIWTSLRIANGKALAAFIGVSPRQRQSGSSVKGRTMISRTGHADLRKALYMPGMVALRHTHGATGVWGKNGSQRLGAEGGHWGSHA